MDSLLDYIIYNNRKFMFMHFKKVVLNFCENKVNVLCIITNLLNSALRLVGFGDESGEFWPSVFWLDATGISNLSCAGRLTAANGDTYESPSFFSGPSSSVPGGGGLFTSNLAQFSDVLCGILYSLSEKTYSPVLKTEEIHFEPFISPKNQKKIVFIEIAKTNTETNTENTQSHIFFLLLSLPVKISSPALIFRMVYTVCCRTNLAIQCMFNAMAHQKQLNESKETTKKINWIFFLSLFILNVWKYESWKWLTIRSETSRLYGTELVNKTEIVYIIHTTRTHWHTHRWTFWQKLSAVSTGNECVRSKWFKWWRMCGAAFSTK